VALLVLTACSPTAPQTSRVQVDTPALRALKQQAGIEPCANGSATNGPLPKITVQCLGGGQAVDLSTLKGPLILNFWGAYCGPCRKEMPALAAFHRDHPQVPIIGVDETDTQPLQALQLAKRSGVTYPLIADPGGDLQDTKLRAPGLPTFFLVDSAGKVSRTSGGLTSEAEVEAMVAKYL
jgi:thiol-disulfide isomerase/thioredoxin